jgi:hypothetical protein
LVSFCDWAALWQLNIAFHKCNVLSLGYGNPLHSYSLGGTDIATVNEIRDLGVMVDSGLKFSSHCSSIANKATNRVSVIFRAFESTDMSVLLRAYITYVRPLLEFETYVWNPHLVKNIECIEKVQRYFTRRLYNRCSFPRIEYCERVSELALDTLQVRRVKTDLVMCFKILHGFVDIEREVFFTLRGAARTRGNPLTLVHNKIRLDVAKFFFTNRICEKWNSLADDVVLSNSVEAFRAKIDRLNL